MSIAKVTEIIASSPEGFDDAVNKGIKRAGKTLENVRSAWVKDLNVVVENGKVTEYRVTMKVSFILNE
jgi:flavin-binding protein dodecin